MIYYLENEFLKVGISDLGATLVSFVYKEKQRDIVLGFDDENAYLLNSDAHIGAVVGRNANRIAKGHFVINDEEYQLSINNGPNNLHSGVGDLSFRVYDVVKQNENELVFGLYDKAFNGGFPGNLKVVVSYRLKGSDLILSFRGICDKDSIFNFTNHSYFNLDDGENDVLDHEFKVFTDRMALNDEDGMASDVIIDIAGTAFDFRDYVSLRNNLILGHDNLNAGGYDHNYVYEDLDFKKLCSLRNNDLELVIKSDLPGLQVYSSNFLGDIKGKHDKSYHKYWGLALEPQYYPNGINYENILSPIIRKDEVVRHMIVYSLNKR